MAGVLTARYATLVTEFYVKPWELDELTPRQIHDLYCHKRAKDGSIAQPHGVDIPKDDKARLTQLLMLAPALGAKPEQIELLRRKIEAMNGDAPGTT